MEIPIKPLIQDMKDSGEFTGIKEEPLKTYYTCVRYSNIQPLYNNGSPIQIWTEAGPWSCTKGWFEMYGTSFRDKRIDHKVLDYCRFRDTVTALKKDIGEPFVIYIDK
jgi:hypothetical protein